MNAGYTPVFNTIYTGSLYGKWPRAAVWASLLPLLDKDGVLDVSIDALCGMIGWPRDLLIQGIRELCEPDPSSRSDVERGRRLVPLDPNRPWGWRAVNHSLYREKARLKAKNEREVADGLNRERMNKRTAEDRRSPPETAVTASDPLSNANANANADSKIRKPSKSAYPRTSRVPSDFQPDLDYARGQLPDIDAEREAEAFRDYEFKTPRSDWPAAWRTWIRNCRNNGRYTRVIRSSDPAFAQYVAAGFKV